jgi:hypothetical protein
MTPLDWYGIGAVALVGLSFYCVRRIPAYLGVGLCVVGAFAAATYPSLDVEQLSGWSVMTAGLFACVFGLLTVRVMLIRSVSLQLLARMDGAQGEVFGQDIRGRLHDMRLFHLIRPTERGNTLTRFGRLVSSVVIVSYSLLRIRK